MAKKAIDIEAKIKPVEAAADWKKVAVKGEIDAELPADPTVVADKTYVLKLVNGVKTWVEETV